MRRRLTFGLVLALLVPYASPAFAETTLEKITRTGVLTIGTRSGAPPFAFIDKNNEWVGFSVDLAEQAILPELSRKLGKPIKIEKKEVTPTTRIPMLISKTIDLGAETMTDTRYRREQVDTSITIFITGAQFLVKKGSPIRGIQDIAGKRIAAQQGATNARIIRQRVPTAQLLEFPDQPQGFRAVAQGQADAYTNDGIQLWGLKAKAPNPDEWEVVGDFYSYEPLAFAMRPNESDFRNIVNNTLMDAIDSGLYFKLYDKWFGPKGEVPYPMSPEMKLFLKLQVVPK